MNEQDKIDCRMFIKRSDLTTVNLSYIALELDRIANVLERLADDLLRDEPAPKEDRD